MLQDNATCKSLCVSSVPAEDAKFINDRIREDYALNWLIDGLPAAEMKIDMNSKDMFFDMGFNLGNDDGPNAERPPLNNHYDIVLRYASCLTSWPDIVDRCNGDIDITLPVLGSIV
jgi:transmembrane 9 superfamily protein 2/4